MQKLNLPLYQFRTKTAKGKVFIFDVWRKKWVTLTPEEWVRQHFIRFLVEEYHYPSSAIGIEVCVGIAGRNLRADALVYSASGDKSLLLEFKAPSVSITEEVFSQAADYNTQIGAPYTIVSNGIVHFCAQLSDNNLSLLNDIPVYSDL